jgi:hypothetical protein
LHGGELIIDLTDSYGDYTFDQQSLFFSLKKEVSDGIL